MRGEAARGKLQTLSGAAVQASELLQGAGARFWWLQRPAACGAVRLSPLWAGGRALPAAAAAVAARRLLTGRSCLRVTALQGVPSRAA